MHECASCDRGCGGCARELTLTEGELKLLDTLAQIPFLPLARRGDDATPIYLEDDAYSREEWSVIVQLLEKKGLIRIDFDQPLKNADPGPYAAWPIQGSMALTQRGGSVLELLDTQGIG